MHRSAVTVSPSPKKRANYALPDMAHQTVVFGLREAASDALLSGCSRSNNAYSVYLHTLDVEMRLVPKKMLL